MSRRTLYTAVYLLSAVLISAMTLLADGLAHIDDHTTTLVAGGIATMTAVPVLLAGAWRIALRKIDAEAERHARNGYFQCFQDVRDGRLQVSVVPSTARKVMPLRGRLPDHTERNIT